MLKMGDDDKEEEEEEASPQILAAVTRALEQLVLRNDRVILSSPLKESNKDKKQVFEAARAPSISVGRYLERIYRYTSCSPACFVVGFVYVDRLVHRHPGQFVVGSINVHRLLLTSILVASKVLDDMHHDNALFAKVGGVSNKELNLLELELLFLLDFRLMVTPRTFASYCMFLEKGNIFSGAGQKIEREICNQIDKDEVEKPSNRKHRASSSSHHLGNLDSKLNQQTCRNEQATK